MKQWIKRLVLGTGRKPCRIPLGLYRGLNLSIDSGQESLLYFGLYEAETNVWLRRFVADAKALVDVGAGCGELTAWALSRPGMQHVIAYDASPTRWDIFRENMRLNSFDQDQRLTAVEDYFPAGDATAACEAVLGELPEPVVLKIDVDGGEVAILTAMRNMLGKKEFRFLVETHSQQLDEGCRKILENAGYRCQTIRPAWWRCIFPERRPEAFNQWIAAWRS